MSQIDNIWNKNVNFEAVHKFNLNLTLFFNTADYIKFIIDFNKSGIRIKTADYDIVITYLQFPNKNIINSNDAYNSHKKFFI